MVCLTQLNMDPHWNRRHRDAFENIVPILRNFLRLVDVRVRCQRRSPSILGLWSHERMKVERSQTKESG